MPDTFSQTPQKMGQDRRVQAGESVGLVDTGVQTPSLPPGHALMGTQTPRSWWPTAEGAAAGGGGAVASGVRRPVAVVTGRNVAAAATAEVRPVAVGRGSSAGARAAPLIGWDDAAWAKKTKAFVPNVATEFFSNCKLN